MSAAQLLSATTMLLAYTAQVSYRKLLLLLKYTTYTPSRDAKKMIWCWWLAWKRKRSVMGFSLVLKLETYRYCSWNLIQTCKPDWTKTKMCIQTQISHPCLLIQICSPTDRVTGSPYRWRSCQDAFSTARICDIKKFDSAVLTSCSQLILIGWAPIQAMNLKDKRKTCQDCMPDKQTH